MSGSTTKKVVLARFDREPLRGFVNPQTWLRDGAVELLAPDGAVSAIATDQIKAICFVRDLSGTSIFQERREFRNRPKSAGLWIELLFRDGDRVEGMVPNNLISLETEGISFTPPDPAGNSMRVFAPREALRSVTVLGVIGVPKKLRRPEPSQQISLFSTE